MNELNNSDIGVMFSFVGLIAGIISSAKFTINFFGKHSHSVKGYGLVLIIVFFGLFFPAFIILSTDWVGWKHILLNIVAFYGLVSFFMLLFIIKKMMSVGKPKSTLV